MSAESLKEAIERDTVADEAETSDADEDTDEAEDEQSDEQIEPESAPPVLSDLDVERAFKKAEKVQARYEKQLAEALGPIFEDLQPSPLDDIPGYVFPFDPNTDLGDFKRAAVAAYFGDDAPDLRENPDSAACETCEGWGEVLSGAKNATHRVIACPRCGGTGWKVKATAPTPAPYQAVPGEIVPQSLDANQNGGERDAFGRPAGHPRWGELPTFTGDN